MSGTVATEVLWLFNLTTAPVAGAGADSVTVAMTVVPPTTLDWASVNAVSAAGTLTAGLTVNVAVFWAPL